MPLPNPFPPSVRTVGVFCPAGVPEAAPLARGLRLLEAWGLQVILAAPGQAVRFLAGSDAERAEALNGLLRNPRVDLLLAARGGYGCARLLPQVDWDLFLARRLPLVGYSDLTALHAEAFRRGSTFTVSGPMVSSTFGRLPRDGYEQAMRETLDACARVLRREPGRAHPAPLQSLRGGTATGPLVPANLSVLVSLVGTPFMPDLTGAILVVEDINEAAYRVDRMLLQLDQAGWIERLGGLVFGQFDDAEDAHWLPEVFEAFAARVSGPVAAGLPFGHGFPSISLPVGRPGLLDCSGGTAWLDLL